MRIQHIAAVLLLSASTIAMPRPAVAAESYDTCAHYIDAVPRVADQQGVWCLRKDVATGQAEGNAIEITANNVTIDCNDFKIGGLAAGNASDAVGIYASGRQNVTIRHCNIRGFRYGITLEGGAGHLVEDNRVDGSLQTGILIYFSGHNMVRRNRVFDTGGYHDGEFDDSLEGYFGIRASADIIDNIVEDVSTTGGAMVYGISTDGSGARIAGNRVGGALQNHSGSGYGINIEKNMVTGVGRQAVVGNRIAADPASGVGIGGPAYSTYDAYCAGNTVANFNTAIESCQNGSGNLSH